MVTVDSHLQTISRAQLNNVMPFHITGSIPAMIALLQTKQKISRD